MLVLQLCREEFFCSRALLFSFLSFCLLDTPPTMGRGMPLVSGDFRQGFGWQYGCACVQNLRVLARCVRGPPLL